jgi:cholesterol transport system auxiliary component
MRALLLAPWLAFSAGCSGLFETDAQPVQAYVLRVAPSDESEGVPIKGSLRVSRPLASPGLESERIVLVQSDHRLSYFTASRWAGALPEVVESLAVEKLRSAGVWNVVQDSRSSFPSDYSLQITVRRFDADYTRDPNAPVVRVTLDCVLGRRADRELLSAFSTEVTEQSSENRLAAIVQAFEVATNKVLDRITERAAEAIRTSKVPSPP